MPINIPNNLPAYKTLLNENIFVMSHDRASKQDIRPLRIAILNLMPTKIVTETQLLRLLSNTALQVDIDLIQTASHTSKNTSASHLHNFYTTFDKVRHLRYDGLIITGAPIEHLEYDDVNYWDELKEILEWSKTNVYSTMHICWAAGAGLFYHYGVEKHLLDEKVFGVFPHKVNCHNNPLLNSFDDVFMVPHSRYTDIKREDIDSIPSLNLLSYSDECGVYLVADKTNRQIFITGHSEYDRDTLKNEYLRDIERGINTKLPKNYFPDNNPDNTPILSWRCHSSLMFSNWLNFCVYQQTPFDLNELEPLE
mgnify:FL=1